MLPQGVGGAPGGLGELDSEAGVVAFGAAVAGLAIDVAIKSTLASSAAKAVDVLRCLLDG